MNAAIVVMILAIIGLGVWGVFFVLRMGLMATEKVVAFVRHEMMMRPQTRYYRM
jgi:hypothetical protein